MITLAVFLGILTALVLIAVALPRPQVALHGVGPAKRIDAILSMDDLEYARATGRL